MGRNLKLWTAVFAELDAHTARLRASGALAAHADTEFHYNREELFARLRQPVERRLEDFNAEAEGMRSDTIVKKLIDYIPRQQYDELDKTASKLMRDQPATPAAAARPA